MTKKEMIKIGENVFDPNRIIHFKKPFAHIHMGKVHYCLEITLGGKVGDFTKVITNFEMDHKEKANFAFDYICERLNIKELEK